jgi:sirohydrochlorin cobaltochelatase
MSEPYQCSVVLAAHGSLATAEANEPLFELANQIAASEIFSTVTPAFLNGDPQLSSVLQSLPIGDVVVIPVMTSNGYYCDTVLPKVIVESPGFENYRVSLTAPLGVHPEIASLVADRISILMNMLQLASHETTIVIVGHGTTRNAHSGKSTEQLAAQVHELLSSENINIAFIDQAPTMDEVIRQITTPHTIVVPFLISRGPHATDDVPAAFGLPTGPEIEFPLVGLVADGITICDLPVGMYPEMSDLCTEMATDQMMVSGRQMLAPQPQFVVPPSQRKSAS